MVFKIKFVLPFYSCAVSAGFPAPCDDFFTVPL